MREDCVAVKTEYEPPDASDGSSLEAHDQLLDDVQAARPFGFVVSLVDSRRRRLHFEGHCFR